MNDTVPATVHSLASELSAQRTQAAEQPSPEAAPQEQPSNEAEAVSESSDEPGTDQPDAVEAPESAEADSESAGEDDGESFDDSVESEEGAEEEPIFTVNRGGKDIPVTLEEARQGYMRQDDYTRKTQAVADQQKAATAEYEQARSHNQRLLEEIQAVSEAVIGTPPPRPDPALLQTDPQAFYTQQQAVEQWQESAQQWQTWRTQKTQEQQQAAEQERAKTLQAEAEKFVAAFPDVKDDAAFTARVGEVQGYLSKSFGYQPEELAQVIDHRAYVVAHKAMLYDQMMESGKGKASLKAKKARVKPVTSGTKQRPSKLNARDQATERFNKVTDPQGGGGWRDQVAAASAALAEKRGR